MFDQRDAQLWEEVDERLGEVEDRHWRELDLNEASLLAQTRANLRVLRLYLSADKMEKAEE